MSSRKCRTLALPVLVAGAIAIFGLRTNGSGQAGAENPASNTKDAAVVKLSVEAASASRVSPAFEKAALQNGVLQSRLNWIFGGKTQRGWQLYNPLISSLIGTDDDPTSGRFAVRLSRWQAENRLLPTGILDERTWSQMVAVLQSARMKDRSSATADQLVIAPASDFYDPSREDELRKVERRTYKAYQRMIQAAVADRSLGLIAAGRRHLAPEEKFLKIVSAYRSPAHQQRLRQQSPQSGRAGLAVMSPHFTGRALDLYVGGEPVSTKDGNRAIQVNTRVYRWLVKNSARFGFRPYFYEPWHWEYVSD